MLAASAGAGVGYLAGRKIKQIKLKANEVELQNLTVAADMSTTREFRQEVVSNRSSNTNKQVNEGQSEQPSATGVLKNTWIEGL